MKKIQMLSKKFGNYSKIKMFEKKVVSSPLKKCIISAMKKHSFNKINTFKLK